MEGEKQVKTSSIFRNVAFGLLIVALLEAWIIYKLYDFEDRILLPNYFFSESDPNFQDTFFTAKGSWISDTKLAIPAQTVELTCHKDFGYCFETIAQLMEGSFLSVSTDLKEIDLWTKDVITTKPTETAAGCVEYTINIDRINKRVTSLRTTKNNTKGLCENVSDEPIASYLGDGLDRIDKIKSQK